MSGSIQSTPLNAVTATGRGNPTLYQNPRKNHTMQVKLGGSAAATAVVVTLEGGLDCADTTNRFTLGTFTLSADQPDGSAIFVSDAPVNWVNANLTTLTGGTAPTVTASVTSEN